MKLRGLLTGWLVTGNEESVRSLTMFNVRLLKWGLPDSCAHVHVCACTHMEREKQRKIIKELAHKLWRTPSPAGYSQLYNF